MSSRKDRIRVHISGQEFSVVGGDFQEMLTVIKQINGRRFVRELKVWQLPGTAEEIQEQLEASGYWLEGGMPVDQEALASVLTTAAGQDGDRIRVLVGGHQLAVVGGTFHEMLSTIKGLPGRKYDAENKIWELPGDVGVIQGLIQAAGYELEGVDKIQATPVPEAESLDFAVSSDEPLPFEEPNFFGDDDIPPYEPPAWWDDDARPAPIEPPDWLEHEMAVRQSEETLVGRTESATASPAAAESALQREGDRVRIRVGGIPMVVTGGSFQAMLDVVKQIPGRRFSSQDKVWDIPADVGLDGVKRVVNAAGYGLKRD